MKRPTKYLRDRKLGTAVRVAAALLLLVAIASDLVADTRCDNVPPESVSQLRSLATPARTDQSTVDPCGWFCVPDCFCCSQLVAGVAIAVPVAVPCPVDIVSDRADRWPIGVRPIPYHPPLLLS